jgi:hypothetical protein
LATAAISSQVSSFLGAIITHYYREAAYFLSAQSSE